MKKNLPENSGRKQDGTFLSGVSGNPAGKPKGARNKATKDILNLFEGEAEALSRKAIELALAGDPSALKLCISRFAPPLKSVSASISLESAPHDNLSEIAVSILEATLNGDIPPDIASQMVATVSNVARVEEMEAIKGRLEALEKAIKEQKL